MYGVRLWPKSTIILPPLPRPFLISLLHRIWVCLLLVCTYIRSLNEIEMVLVHEVSERKWFPNTARLGLHLALGLRWRLKHTFRPAVPHSDDHMQGSDIGIMQRRCENSGIRCFSKPERTQRRRPNVCKADGGSCDPRLELVISCMGRPRLANDWSVGRACKCSCSVRATLPVSSLE